MDSNDTFVAVRSRVPDGSDCMSATTSPCHMMGRPSAPSPAGPTRPPGSVSTGRRPGTSETAGFVENCSSGCTLHGEIQDGLYQDRMRRPVQEVGRMGHTRLGRLARTRRWLQVIGLLQAGATAAQVARATMIAAEQGFTAAANDPGLQQAFWLLTQLPLAARSAQFVERLREAGLQVSDRGNCRARSSRRIRPSPTRTAGLCSSASRNWRMGSFGPTESPTPSGY